MLASALYSACVRRERYPDSPLRSKMRANEKGPVFRPALSRQSREIDNITFPNQDRK